MGGGFGVFGSEVEEGDGVVEFVDGASEGCEVDVEVLEGDVEGVEGLELLLEAAELFVGGVEARGDGVEAGLDDLELFVGLVESGLDAGDAGGGLVDAIADLPDDAAVGEGEEENDDREKQRGFHGGNYAVWPVGFAMWTVEKCRASCFGELCGRGGECQGCVCWGKRLEDG